MLLDTHDEIPPLDQRTNTFVAIRPPRPIAEQFHAKAARVCANARIIGSRRPPDILHMTLLSIGRHLGRLPRPCLEEIDAAIRMVQFPAFEIVLDEAGSFETRKDSVPFVLEGKELTDACVLGQMARCALHVKDLRIPARATRSPHMTIAYSARRAPRARIEPFRWKAREFQLIESWVGRTKYVELARWSLRE